MDECIHELPVDQCAICKGVDEESPQRNDNDDRFLANLMRLQDDDS